MKEPDTLELWGNELTMLLEGKTLFLDKYYVKVTLDNVTTDDLMKIMKLVWLKWYKSTKLKHDRTKFIKKEGVRGE